MSQHPLCTAGMTSLKQHNAEIRPVLSETVWNVTSSPFPTNFTVFNECHVKDTYSRPLFHNSTGSVLNLSHLCVQRQVCSRRSV